jgi:hypothetical protein
VSNNATNAARITNVIITHPLTHIRTRAKLTRQIDGLNPSLRAVPNFVRPDSLDA